jgi:hypothetical protein
MKNVYLYGFTGKYSGNPEYDYEHPELNAVHNCMLFLAQEKNELLFEEAKNEMKKFGFEEITNLKGNELKVEVLNTEQFKGFSGFYEEALNDGSALVYYPNT